MEPEVIKNIEKEISTALSGLHTLILAYGFNKSPMSISSKTLLPSYGNQIADMLGVIDTHITNANELIKSEVCIDGSKEL